MSVIQVKQKISRYLRQKGIEGLNYADHNLGSQFHFVKDTKHCINEVF